MGGRSRSGKVLRSSQPRQTDESSRQAGKRPTASATDSELAYGRCVGERTRGTDGGGTPQGGPISPLLSNLVLDQRDRELERRGHRFVHMRTTATSRTNCAGC